MEGAAQIMTDVFKWMSVKDDRVRLSHEIPLWEFKPEYEKVKLKGLSAWFRRLTGQGGYHMREVMTHRNNINCRCSIIHSNYKVKEDGTP